MTVRELKKLTIPELKEKSEHDVRNFIRYKLLHNKRNSIIDLDDESLKDHKRFDMSGYDYGTTGDCVLHNTEVLNTFAYLGIYDFTSYLFLDFYQGGPTLYLKYWCDDKNLVFDFDGYGTTEIIHEIFKLTIFTDKKRRKRN